MRLPDVSKLKNKNVNVQVDVGTFSEPTDRKPLEERVPFASVPPLGGVATGTANSAQARAEFESPNVQTSTPYGPHSIDENQLKTTKFLNTLHLKGVSDVTLQLLAEDLRVEENETSLRQSIVRAFPEIKHQQSIITALEIAKRAHHGQFQERKSEKNTGLGHIPYVNHPIQLARRAVQLGMSSDVVQACLLHDVVEDTPVTLKQLGRDFSPRVVELVSDLTRKENEARPDYLERVTKLGESASSIKSIDRLHNLLRSFSSRDAEYLGRYIQETEDVYRPKFETNASLESLKMEFDQLMVELKHYRETLLSESF